MVASLRLTRSHRAAIALAIAFAAIAAPARAQDAGEVPPEAAPPESAPIETMRPFFVSLGIGTGVRLDGSMAAAFRIVEELGLHLDGVPVGPFVALMLAEDITSAYSMQIGVRVGWDLELLRRDFSIVASPSLGVAFAFDVVGPSTFAYFDVQPALGVALLLLDRQLAIWIRPIGVGVYIGEFVHAGWAAVAGATLAF